MSERIQRFGLLIVLVASIAVGLVATSNDSLWIDEGGWACAAIGVGQTLGPLEGILGEWNSPRNWVKGSDPAKPLYGVYLWTWEKVFGHSERTLRLSNLPWLLVAQTALWFGLSRHMRLRVIVAACVLMSPFVWFYLNETSHYIMLFAGACIVIAVLARLAAPENTLKPIDARWFLAFGIGLLLLCGSNAMGIPWAGAASVSAFCLVLGRRSIRWNPATLAAGIFTGICLVALAFHYKRWNPAQSGMVTGFSLLNAGFAGYELLGFSGLGPSRIMMREAGFSALKPFLLSLSVLALLIASVMGVALREVLRRFNVRMWAGAATYVLLGLSIVLITSALSHFRLLGRHLAPVEPAVILLFAIGIHVLLSRGKAGGRFLAAGLCFAWLASAVSLRFDSRHARDDYRTAAALAIESLQEGKVVWWGAATTTGAYYQVPLSTEPQVTGKAFTVSSPMRDDLETLPIPDVVILSKPDVYDAPGNLTKLLTNHSFQKTRSLTAFTVWERRLSGDNQPSSPP